MKAPAQIWACDGETPYFYNDREPRPKTAVRYTRSDQYADILQELDRVKTALADLLVTAKHYGGLRDRDAAAIRNAEAALANRLVKRGRIKGELSENPGELERMTRQREIAAAYATDEPVASIAARFGISKSTVRYCAMREGVKRGGPVSDVTNDDIRAAIAEHGSRRAAARALGRDEKVLRQRGF